MNHKKQNKRLKDENLMLKLEILSLKMKLQSHTSEWVHPRSCLHNDDPWGYLK
jgi:hypothetical protein